jgi:hypothetical protein
MLAYWAVGFAIAFGGVGLTGPTNLGAGLLALNKEAHITVSGSDYGIFGYKGFFLGPDTLDVGIAVLFLFWGLQRVIGGTIFLSQHVKAGLLSTACLKQYPFLLIALARLVVGVALLRRARWAWQGAMAFMCYDVVWLAFRAVYSVPNTPLALLFGDLLGKVFTLLLCAGVIYYLRSPRVTAAFQARDTRLYRASAWLATLARPLVQRTLPAEVGLIALFFWNQSGTELMTDLLGVHAMPMVLTVFQGKLFLLASLLLWRHRSWTRNMVAIVIFSIMVMFAVVLMMMVRHREIGVLAASTPYVGLVVVMLAFLTDPRARAGGR